MNRLFLIVCMMLLETRLGLADDQMKWGQPVSGLRIGVESAVTLVKWNQIPAFKVTAQNVSRKPITIPTSDTLVFKKIASRGFHETALTTDITKDQIFVVPGNRVYGILTSADTGPTVEMLHVRVITLAPGQSVTWNNVPMGRAYYTEKNLPPSRKTRIERDALPPGYIYHIKFQFANDQALVANAAVWTGRVASGAVDITATTP